MATLSESPLTLNTKLRNLPLRETNKLIHILDRNNCWRELASVITHPDNSMEFLFNSDDISILEHEWRNGNSPGEALLQHWATYGKELPNLKDLIRFLEQADLVRAVSDVKKELLKIEEDDELECEGEVSNTVKCIQKEATGIDFIDSILSDLNLDDLVIFSYKDLQMATQNFCDLPLQAGGCKIGEGAYGAVYRAVIGDAVVAVKRLKDPVDRQFITELKTLTNYRHENLLPLLGCSLTGPTCCILYEYMPNGSLQERLACFEQSEPLSWQTRLSISYGSALGIDHLHTFGGKPVVHRDIKSANILLDQNFVPRVGDFGLVRTGSSGGSTTKAVTENVYGTCVYMAREAFSGDVSVKLDTFSFGVVLLELLTGLPPFDPNREDPDLITHMQNCEDILTQLDPRTEWNEEAATALYGITQRCLTEAKKFRPTIAEILEDLRNCLSYATEEN